MMMRSFQILITIFLLAIISWTISCSKKAEMQIGVISILSGEGANYGQEARRGIELALEELRSTDNKVAGNIRLIYEDSRGDPSTAVNAFRKLVSIDKVPIVIGPFLSSEVLAIAPIANQNRVVIISGSATSDKIKTAGEFVFRVCSSNDVQGKTLAHFAVENLHARTAYVLYQNNEYGVSLQEVFQQEFIAAGGVILGTDAFPPGVTDLRSQLAKVKAASPDVIFSPAHYSEAGLLLKQARELAINAVVLGGDGSFDPKLIEIAGNAAEGSYWSTMGLATGEAKHLTSHYDDAFRKLFKTEPGVYSAYYYDAMKIVAYAAARANAFDGPSLRDALLAVKDFEGPTGVTSFDSRGEVDKPFSIYEVVQARFAPVD